MRVLLIGLLFTATIAGAQTFTHSQYVIRMDDGKPYSVFPMISSATRPKAAEVMNKTLQIVSFSKIVTAKNPKALENTDAEDYTQWSFSVDYSNDRLVRVATNQWIPAGGMHTPAYDIANDFLFDAETGDRMETMNFFSSYAKAEELIKNRLDAQVKKRYAELKKKYPASKFLPNLTECLESMKSQMVFAHTPLNFNLNEKSFEYSTGWCVSLDDDSDEAEEDRKAVEAIPELRESFSVKLNAQDILPFTTPTWAYYILHQGPRPDQNTIYHLWSGVIGGKIPVTMYVRQESKGYPVGVEVYDRVGVLIDLRISKSGDTYRFDEIVDEKTNVGHFEVNVTGDGHLTGKWEKADGSKTMDFKASIGAK